MRDPASAEEAEATTSTGAPPDAPKGAEGWRASTTEVGRERLLAMGAAALAVAWLVLRPSAPHGVEAVADLAVLPLLLLAEIRLLAGRTTRPPADFALFFGLGAVFAALSALLLERAAGWVVGPAAMHVVGPLVESAATCVPLVVAVLAARGHGWTVPDTTVAGLASGLGLLVVQATLATATLHAGPSYVSPLAAGWARVPESAGAPATYYVGPALSAALVGLALGLALRRPARPWLVALVVPVFGLGVFDHALFDWRLDHLVDASPALTSGLVEAAERVSLYGRLSLLLLVGGLVAARLSKGDRAGDRGGDDGETAVPRADSKPSWAGWTAIASAVLIGVVLTLAARARHLGVLDRRPAAIVAAFLGLGFALWHLPTDRSPERRGDLRFLLGVAAVVSSSLGVIWALLPAPEAVTPLHGSLFSETVEGWRANVGNLGFVLGLGGLAAPVGRQGSRRFGDRWSDFIRRGLRWTGWPGRGGAGGGESARSGRGSAGDDAFGRVRYRGPGGRFRWFRMSGRWSRFVQKRRRGGAGAPDEPWGSAEPVAAVTIEPVYRSPEATTEFVGATVQQAIEAAMRALGPDLAHSSLQLVDLGGAAKPGKAGSGRPARVRVAGAGDDADALVPPARDSITRDTPFCVVVDRPVQEDEEPAERVVVSLRVTRRRPPETRRLSCALIESSAVRACYRSNPYALDGGEEPTYARVEDKGSGGPAVAAGMDADNGAQLLVDYQGARAAITVYDGWAQQVVAVNGRLFDLAEQHHSRVRGVLEEELGQLGDADASPRIRRCSETLSARLRSVEQGRRVLSEAGTGPGADVVKAFLSTAYLHAALSVDDQDELVDAAALALEAARASGPADPGPGQYREFLVRTAAAPLWATGAYSEQDVARLLRWDRFVEDDSTNTPEAGSGS